MSSDYIMTMQQAQMEMELYKKGLYGSKTVG